MSYDIHDYLEDMEAEGYLPDDKGLEVTRVVKWSEGVQVSELVVDAKSWGWVDAGLCEVLEKINQAGYQSAQSCSGLKADHEHKETTRGGYIAWFLDDLNEGQVRKIEVAASKAGLDFKVADLFFLPAVTVRADRLADGTREIEVREEATRVTNREWGIERRPDEMKAFMAWLKRRDLLMREGAERHGGLAIKTDETLKAAWELFARALVGEAGA